jgi:serine/threonine-protein kinase
LVRIPHGPERQFGDFSLVVKLGWGGMADVYLAVPKGEPPRREAALVVKRLKPDLVFDTEYRAMFKDEAKLALRLDHPNIVAAKEMGEVDGQPFLAMEYLDGQSLDKILESSDKARLTRGEILLVMRELLCGMHHAHELRDENGEPLDIVHRDVSPHNVFITYLGEVKLVDFGIAKSREKAQHTTTGVVKGKIAYMAPEQALCSAVDKRADVFAAGVILWELITGKRFWGDLSDVQILKTMTFGDLPSLEDHLPNASPELVAMCTKALAITPQDRYATAAEFRADIERFIERLGERVTAEQLGATVARIAGDKRRALDHVIDQQFERSSLAGRDDTPLSVEIPSGPREAEGAVVPPAPASMRGGPPSSAVPSSEPFETSTLDPVSAARRDASPDSGAAGDDASARAPAPMWRAPPKKPSPWPWIALGGAALLGLAAIGVRTLTGPPGASAKGAPSPSTSPSGVGAEPAASSSAASSSAARAASSGAVDGAGDYVSVRIAVSPVDAKAKLDGNLLHDNPFTAKFKRDGLAHRLTVEATGYRSLSQMIVFDRDLDLTPTLEAATSKGAPTVAPSAPSSGGSLHGAVDSSDPWAKKHPKR